MWHNRAGGPRQQSKQSFPTVFGGIHRLRRGFRPRPGAARKFAPTIARRLDRSAPCGYSMDGKRIVRRRIVPLLGPGGDSLG